MTEQTKGKIIFTGACTGAIHTPTMSPHLPVTVRQIIDDILSIYEAGGSLAHVHGPMPTRRCSGKLQARLKKTMRHHHLHYHRRQAG